MKKYQDHHEETRAGTIALRFCPRCTKWSEANFCPDCGVDLRPYLSVYIAAWFWGMTAAPPILKQLPAKYELNKSNWASYSSWNAMGNPAGNKFCYDCGGSLRSLACSFCSQLNPHYAKFCGSCGRKLKK